MLDSRISIPMEEEVDQDVKTLVETVVKRLRKMGSPAFELVVQRSVEWEVEANRGKIDRSQYADITEAAIRILKGGRLGFSYTSSLSAGHLEGWLERAVQGSMYTSLDEDLQFAAPGPDSPQELNIFDESLLSRIEEERREQALLLEEGALQSDPRVKKVRRAVYSETHQWTWLVNSLGVDLSAKMTLVEGSLEAVAEGKGGSQAAWESGFSHFSREVQMREIGARAGAKAAGLLGARQAPTMKIPAIISNSAAVDLLGILAPSFLAENLYKGKSMLRGKLGKRLFPEHLHILDDGLIPVGIAAYPFDGEGTPSQRTAVVASGTVEQFLYDLRSAKREEKTTTGNSIRDSLKAPPRPGIRNFFIPPSDLTRDTIYGMIPVGIVISNFLGTHLADPVSGDFSLGAIGYWMEKGTLHYPLQEMVITGNILSLFQKIAAVGEDFRFVDTIGSPSLLIEEVEVSGS